MRFELDYRDRDRRDRDDDHHGGGLNILGLLVNILFSPAIFFIYFWLKRDDVREAALITLYILSAFNLISFAFKVLKILVSTLTFNIIGAFKSSLQIISAILILAFYWIIYLAVWGQNFAL